ncbi:MAG: 4'-phosphopantetheinyl transferase superfamily protein [Thermoanaerobaculia bacterium]|nr:4'-phosphopantetheinyl transferase superfamily protein [Thermoanaerobaculia bacterium]
MTSTRLGPGDFAIPRAEAPRLEPGEVHVWAIDLDPPQQQAAALRPLLSTDERERADSFRFDRHRRRFIVTRAATRRLLGAYGERAPASVEITYGANGKPSVLDEPELEFNLSHSEDKALVAVSRSGPVGVDIERLRPLDDADDIARRFFSRREVKTYLAQPEALRPRAFFNGWTRKEAVVKALGEGLFLSLQRFDVSLESDAPARILAIDGRAAEARAWELCALEPEAEFVGALATPWRPDRVLGFAAGRQLEALPRS